MNLLEATNCIKSVKATMKAPYKPQLLKLLLNSENLQDSKINLQRKMELLKNDNSYNMSASPVWHAILTQKCPSGENLVSFDKTTKIFKMNITNLTSEQKTKLIRLTGGLLK